ncbi:hypothetical protein ABMA28_000239 [Loxostege sticticalis]|uniref:Geminin n=1 Tax=Loxostege sticticalis TaxID=481309 RepID=A0ABD0TRW9_LOXSC
MDCNRRNLGSLHGNNVDEENCGKSKKSLKDYFPSRENDSVKKKTCSKTTQVNIEAWVSDGDLSSDVPTESYWKVLAEKRRIALEDALKENERLWIMHETLTKENAHNRHLLDEANSFIEVFKEVVKDTADDTGIDVGDVSLCNGDAD